MRHTIAFSDTHIHDDSHLKDIEDLCSYVEGQRPSLLVLVGDIGDPWQSKWQDILRTRSWERLSRLCADRDAAGLETVYIRGNHDNGVKTGHLKTPKKLKRLKIRWTYREGTFLFTHGWQWDPFWGGSGGRIAFWINRNLPCLMMPLYNVWSKWKGSTPATLKGQGKGEEWTDRTQTIHDMAEKHAGKKGVTVVLGHTHYPWLNSLIADAGDWEDSFSLVEITEDGEPALKHMVDGVMKDLERIDALWPEKNTAFLVVHGAGPHRPFEALGSFVRGFRGELQRQKDLNIQWEHKLRRRDDRIENYVSLTSAGKPSVDFYEYYWDRYMVRDVTIGEAVEWLDEASAGARRFYKEDLPARADCYRRLGIDLFKDGEFDPLGYRAILGLSRALLRLKLLMTPFRGWSSNTLDNLIGDVITYTTSDVRSRYYEIRENMLSGAVDELRALLMNDSYGQIVVVGHSLGSIIAYDALNRIDLDMSTEGGLSPERASRIAGLVTFGSPLDKIAFFFQYRLLSAEDQKRWRKKRSPVDKMRVLRKPRHPVKTPPPKNFVQNEITLHSHSFKKLPLSIDEKALDISDPMGHHLDRAAWLNFHHMKDRVSGHLDAYRDVENIECRKNVKGHSEAHSIYWTWGEMYRHIARHFFERHFEAAPGVLSGTTEVAHRPMGYCVKCKKKVQLCSTKVVILKNKRPASQGVCPDCGTKAFGIGKEMEEPSPPPPAPEKSIAAARDAIARGKSVSYELATAEESIPVRREAERSTAKTSQADSQDEAQERYVNLWFTRHNNDQARIPQENTLVRDHTVYLRVQIAPFDKLTILKDAQPFPNQEDIWRAHPELKGKEIPLEITLFSNDFEISEDQRTKPLTLKLGDPTTILYFPVKPTQLGRAQLRLCVFYQNHMLQSLTARASVAATETVSDEQQEASIEMTFSPDFDDADQMPRRTAWIGINDNTDGTHTIMVKGHQKTALARRLESKIENALRQGREKLLQVSFREGTLDYRFDQYNRPLENTSFERDMIDLALKGSELFNAVIGDEARPSSEDFDEAQADSKVLRELLCQSPTGGQELTIQIVRFHFDSMWPWAMMYDLPINSDISQVCTEFSADGTTIRRYGECLSTCPHRHPTSGKHDRRIVCPYGFWGFKAIIEQPVTHGKKRALPRVVNMGTEEALFEMPAIKQVDDNHVDRMSKNSFKVLDSRAKVEGSFERGEPHIVYFFCHCDRAPDGIFMAVGNNDNPQTVKPNDLINWTEEWQNSSRNPLVFINGCHSVALIPSDLSSFMQPFVNAKASGIIGTEITVHSFLATEFAQSFFERFIARGHPDQRQKVGQIIRDLRLELLMKRNPLGLVYTAYCSADLHLV